jgi:Sulfotransferase family
MRDDRSSVMAVHYGAANDLDALVKTHLFVICPNNSGSTFLKNALATSSRTWNLVREGQNTFGFAGPRSIGKRALGWAADQQWIEAFVDHDYDWQAIKRAWYFQAFSHDPCASVFVEKSPPFLLIVDELGRQFRNARFLFMVRDPYAVVEGIVRRAPRAWRGNLAPEQACALAATHVMTCLKYQRRNVEASNGRGVFFTYEQMCAEPDKVERSIAGLVPELNDLTLQQRLRVKGLYDETLRDMNEQQIARLSESQRSEITDVFRRNCDVMDFFGYPLRG